MNREAVKEYCIAGLCEDHPGLIVHVLHVDFGNEMVPAIATWTDPERRMSWTQIG